MFKKILTEILDYIFPIFCVSCKKEGFWICNSCLNNNFNTKIQSTDSKNPVVKKIYYCKSYSNPLLKKLIHLHKYSYIHEISKVFEQIIQKTHTNKMFRDIDCITFVPLHPKKLRIREFNQSELLAENIAKAYSLPCSKLLSRTLHTKQQAELTNKLQRALNVKDAFSTAEIEIETINKKHILLVDDILSSGATTNECAATLLNSGARSVSVFALALNDKTKFH